MKPSRTQSRRSFRGNIRDPNRNPRVTVVDDATLRLSADALHPLRRCDDGNVLILPTQVEQMLVAGNDEVGLGGQRAGEHMIVVRIVGDYTRRAARSWRAT